MDLLDFKSHLKDMLGRVCVKGGELLFVEIWVKTRKIVGSAILLLDCAQVFLHEERGESEAPIRRMAYWGHQVNCHKLLPLKTNFNPRVFFTITFSRTCTGRRT
jgi:hypothetical protein